MSTVTAIVPIAGYGQRNRHRIGLRETYRAHLRPLSSDTVFIHHICEWSDDPHDILARLEDVGASQIIVINYSWGGGYGSRRLVKEALRRGYQIILVACCDAVWKSTLPRWIGWCLAPLSLTSAPSIDFPAQVKRVVAVYQTQTVPSGHKIYHGKKEVKRTLIHASHLTIDEHPQWSSILMDAIHEALES